MTSETTAFREYCYRWTCAACRRENRSYKIIAGESCKCGRCLSTVKIATVVYDNGSIARVG